MLGRRHSGPAVPHGHSADGAHPILPPSLVGVNSGPLTVLLGPVARRGQDFDGLAAALRQHGELLTPGPAVPDHAVTLEEPALAVLAAVSGNGAHAAALCGIGLGAMVALKVAAGFGRRVTALVLSTTRTPESTAIMSLAHGVRGLLPAETAQRLGAGPGQVMDLLDQVRPVDYRGWTGPVTAPSLVLVGDRDVANLGPSMRLAQSLPTAKLQTVPRMASGWMTAQPERYAGLVADFLTDRPADV